MKLNLRYHTMSHPVDIHVGRRLKQARTLRKQSQTDVARELKLSFQQIQKYEIGSNRIAASRLHELSRILDVTPGYFFEGLDDDAPETKNDPALDIVNAIGSIKDDAIRARILTFIEDVAGVTVSRRS